MKNYLDQFKLTPVMRMRMEQFIFNVADKAVVGYCGGNWKDTLTGKVKTLRIPDSAERITIRNIMGGGETTTDAKTASVAFTMLVNNWFWNQYTDQMSDASNAAFMKAHDGLRRAAYSSKSGLNHSDLFDLTD